MSVTRRLREGYRRIGLHVGLPTSLSLYKYRLFLGIRFSSTYKADMATFSLYPSHRLELRLRLQILALMP